MPPRGSRRRGGCGGLRRPIGGRQGRGDGGTGGGRRGTATRRRGNASDGRQGRAPRTVPSIPPWWTPSSPTFPWSLWIPTANPACMSNESANTFGTIDIDAGLRGWTRIHAQRFLEKDRKVTQRAGPSSRPSSALARFDSTTSSLLHGEWDRLDAAATPIKHSGPVLCSSREKKLLPGGLHIFWWCVGTSEGRRWRRRDVARRWRSPPRSA